MYKVRFVGRFALKCQETLKNSTKFAGIEPNIWQISVISCLFSLFWLCNKYFYHVL